MTQLSVNINKIATLRNARGGQVPDVVEAALRIERYGAHGITVHPRPDGRHIRFSDVELLAPRLTTEFNIEGYPSPEWLGLVLRCRPAQATLVPDGPEALTSNAGWDVLKNEGFLRTVLAQLRDAGIRTSLFVSTELHQIEAAAAVGAHRIELYTEPYAASFEADAAAAVGPFAAAAAFAHSLGLQVNAGHDLSLQNLRYFATHVHPLSEVSIGHALISDALYFGLENVVQMYLNQLR